MPCFEGGHKQHDIANYIVSFKLKFPFKTIIYEVSLYNLYYSFINTPHKILKLFCKLTSVGIASYYPPAEHVDDRNVNILELNKSELKLKSEMLKMFKSQNGESLAKTYAYRDRLIPWHPYIYKKYAYKFDENFAGIVEKIHLKFPKQIAQRLFPGVYSSYGYTNGITNLDKELGLEN